MDVSGALPEEVCLEFRDEEWIQSINYEQIPFKCRRFHEHGHLLRECSLIKKIEQEKTKQNQDEKGFVRPNYKGKGNQIQSKPPQIVTQKQKIAQRYAEPNPGWRYRAR
jgi:hypothetical protein